MRKLLLLPLLLLSLGAKTPDISLNFAGTQKAFYSEPAKVELVVTIPHNEKNLGYCVLVQADNGLEAQGCRELTSDAPIHITMPPLVVPAGKYQAVGVLFQKDGKKADPKQIPSNRLEFEVEPGGAHV
jgi:hypothetical protein